MDSKVEKHLQEVLETNTDPDRLIDVVFRFGFSDVDSSLEHLPLMQRRAGLAAAMTEEIKGVLDRTQRAVGEEPTKVSLFPSLGSAFVQAHPNYVKTLLEQSEVLGAVLNTAPPQGQNSSAGR